MNRIAVAAYSKLLYDNIFMNKTNLPLWIRVFRFAIITALLCLTFVVLYGIFYKEPFEWHHQYMRIAGVSLCMLLAGSVIEAIVHDMRKKE